MENQYIFEGWRSFREGSWVNEIDLRSFIRHNFTMYDGDESFLEGPTQDTLDLWEQVMDLTRQEREAGGVLDMDTKIISTITSHGPGYLNKDKEKIVGFQTDKPFKRAMMPYGGVRMAQKACADNGYTMDPEIVDFFTVHRKTHNAGVFDAYTPEMRACRSSHIITGLPDAYGRGRIIGDYRRIALYGVDRLIDDKEEQKNRTDSAMYAEVIRDREELSEQIRALKDLKKMAASYGYDISEPAKNVREAIQWLYFGYLAAVKEQNGAAMSLGRTSTFLDIYAERDLAEGTFTEKEIQEMVDHFIMKLRLIKFARTPEYNALFSGDPQWITESLAGVGTCGKHFVTKMTYRYLHTLYNLGPSPEPNLTVLWSTRLPESFGTVDGPGVRFVIFLQGCPMRCKYCHNPDTWEMFTGKPRSAQSLLKDFQRNAPYYAKGGITVTGGEALLQIDFLLELFSLAKEQKIHTCLDTSGITYTPGESSYNEKLDKLMELTDLVLLDLKHMDPQAHKELTGHDNRNILAFAKYLAQKQVPVWIRHVVVPGITDDPRQLAQLGAFMGTLPNVVSLDVLPYHVMGVSKYREMGITYPLIGVEAATHEQAKKARQIILAAYRQVRGKQSQ